MILKYCSFCFLGCNFSLRRRTRVWRLWTGLNYQYLQFLAWWVLYINYVWARTFWVLSLCLKATLSLVDVDQSTFVKLCYCYVGRFVWINRIGEGWYMGPNCNPGWHNWLYCKDIFHVSTLYIQKSLLKDSKKLKYLISQLPMTGRFPWTIENSGALSNVMPAFYW